MHRRAQDCIAQNYLTNSKRAQAHVLGVYPTHIARGQGAYLYDHAGKKYLDMICGLGANILGYGNERVAAAIMAQTPYGYSHSFATHHEIECAEKLKELVAFIDAVKFLKSGSEACNAAIKIARAATGRDLVLSHGYHGIGDDFVSLTPPAHGVPKSGRAIGHLGDWPIDKDVAAVIVEPIQTDHSDERRAYLQNLREMCTKHGAVLIFDEVITGFRTPRFCVANYWNIIPDLIVLGKAMGNGMPIAAVGGKYAVMNTPNEYFVSSTYAGETLSLVAAKTTMTLLQTKFSIETLWEHGRKFCQDFNALWPEQIKIVGYPSRGVFVGDEMTRALFFQECCKAGILFGPSWLISFAHIDELGAIKDVLRDVIHRIKLGAVKLEGELPLPAFAAQVRSKA